MKQRILTLILMMSIVLSVTTVPVKAAKKGDCGESLEWSFDNKGTLIISGLGDMNDYDVWGKNAPIPPWNDKCSSIKRVLIEEGVTRIGNNAFKNCENLTEVTFPDSLIEIGNGAFMFTKLAEVFIPDSTKKIEESCFYNCVNLRELCIGKNVEYIGDNSFFNCDNLNSIIIPESVTFIGNSAFGECHINTILYEGSKDQWDGINKANNWDYGSYNEDKIIFNYKDNGNVADYTSYDPNSINVLIDGDYIEFDVKPQIINGRTMVPMRKIFEELGATVDWNDLTQTAIGSRENIIVKFTIDNYIMYKNDVSNSLDVPAQLINGRTLIPLRAVSEAFNCQVGWDGDTNTVSIIDDFTNYTMLYALNDRSKCFLTKNVPNQLNNGWYTEPVQTLYTLEKSAVFKKAEVNAQLDLGWSTEPLVTMYFPDGRTKVVKRSEVETNKNDGWYTDPVQRLYSPEKSAVFKKTEVEAQLAVGWYTEPIYTMYAPDGRKIDVPSRELEAYKKVGWYTNQKDAVAGKYPKQNIRILYIDANSNSVGGIEPTIVWRNDSGKTIKYVYFTCIPYNAVGDIVSCDITGKTYARLQSTGPYETFTHAALEQRWPLPRVYFKRWAEPVIANNGKYSVSTYDTSIFGYTSYTLTEEDYKHVYNLESYWDPIWYNYSIDNIKVTKIDVQYMDGTSETINNPPIWREVFRSAGI